MSIIEIERLNQELIAHSLSVFEELNNTGLPYAAATRNVATLASVAVKGCTSLQMLYGVLSVVIDLCVVISDEDSNHLIQVCECLQKKVKMLQALDKNKMV